MQGFGNLQASLAWMAPFCAMGSQCGNRSKFSTPQEQAKCVGWPYPAVDYSPLEECRLVYGMAALAYGNTTYGHAAESSPDADYEWWIGIPFSDLMALLYPRIPQ